MSLPLPPHIRVPIASGQCSDPWYSWFQDLQRATATTVDTSAIVSDIAGIATALGSPDGSVEGIPNQETQAGTIQGQQSIRTYGQLPNSVVAMLDGDVASPGFTEYYGSSAAGAKGWHAVSDAMAQGAGLSLTIGADGVTTFALADLADSATGTFKLITRDQYGRLSGTSDGTTSDVPEGVNLYYTDERAAAAAPIQSIVAGTNVSVDVTDPANPVISATGGGGGAVDSVNGETGVVVLDATDVGADPTGTAAAIVAAAITNGDTTHAPSGDAVFDALAGKFDKSGGTITGSTNVEGTLVCYSAGSSVNFGGFGGIGSALMTLYGEGKSVEIRPTSRTDNTQAVQVNSSSFIAVNDNAKALGLGGFRWSVVYSATGAINTSDAREKDLLRDHAGAEMAAALDLARLPSIWKWIAAIAEKGESLARWHCSPTVQDCIAVMESHNLDPFAYGFICYDEWYETPEQRDEETGEVTQEYRPAGNRYSLRPSELESFCRRGMMQKIDSMDARLTALGG